MRTYGRDSDGTWVKIATAADGSNDLVYLTTLIQVFLLNLNESPFYGNYGIPAHPSVVTQVFPDFYMIYTQQKFAQYFASLIVSKESNPEPTYLVNVTTHQGVKLNASIPIPY
jgi:hypothetical protein